MSYLGSPTISACDRHISAHITQFDLFNLVCARLLQRLSTAHILFVRVPFEEINTAGVHKVTVSSNDGLDVSNMLSFMVYKKPSILQLLPSGGCHWRGVLLYES